MATDHPATCTCVWCSLKRDLENAYTTVASPPKPPGPSPAQKADMMTTHPADCDCVWCNVARQLNGGGKAKGGDKAGEPPHRC